MSKVEIIFLLAVGVLLYLWYRRVGAATAAGAANLERVGNANAMISVANTAASIWIGL